MNKKAEVAKIKLALGQVYQFRMSVPYDELPAGLSDDIAEVEWKLVEIRNRLATAWGV